MSGIRSATSSDKTAFNLFVPLAKIDPEKRMVFGYASTDAKDMEGETISIDALSAALPGYMKFANLREMHQLSAVGVTKTAEMDEKGLYIGGKIVDDVAWNKVKEGVYKGFSIGGSVTTRDPANNKSITGIDLIEISVVDRPANPDCLIDMWKAARDGNARRPVQKWDCGVAGHEHLAKAEAITCIEGQDNKTATLRTKLIKAVNALDEDGLEAAVNAFEKAQKSDDAPADGEKDKEKEPDKAGDHAAPNPEPKKPVNVSTKSISADEEKSPKVGDLVAFVSDKYTDKGPSSGSIQSVDGDNVTVKHSDASETFDWSKLGDADLKLNDAGQRIWLIKASVEEVTGQPMACLVTILGKADEPAVKQLTLPWVELEKKADEKKADDGDKPKGDYGSHDDAGYADPGYQSDKKPRYPLKDGGKPSEERIRAAWNYINKPKNAGKYSSDQAKEIKDRIISAWKEHIDPDGPPSADEGKKAATNNTENQNMDSIISKLGGADAKGSFKKGLVAAASALYCLDSLNLLSKRISAESEIEGDDSPIPARMSAVIEMFADICKAIVTEEVDEMLENKEIGDLAFPDACAPTGFYYAQPVVNLAKRAKSANERVRDAFLEAIGDKTGSPNFSNLTKAVEALFQKGQDEWSGSKPGNDMGDNDDWTASKPADQQKANDKWPAEMKEAAQKVHDQAVKMGATCDGVHKKADAKGDGKKDPPEPDGDSKDGQQQKKPDGDSSDSKTKKAKDSKDGQDKKDPPADDGDDAGDANKAKKPGDGGDGANDGDEDDAKKSAKASSDDRLSKKVDAMEEILVSIAERLKVGRNPPPPAGSRTPVSKVQDGPIGIAEDGTLKIIDAKNATEEDREAVLKAVMRTPRFIGR